MIFPSDIEKWFKVTAYPFLTSAIYVNYKSGRAKEREYKVWTMVFFRFDLDL